MHVYITFNVINLYYIFLIDYKKILKIAGGVKQLTVPLLPDPNCSMPENDAQCVIPVKRTSRGFVHVYKIIKQLFHACSGNNQNYCPAALEMTWKLLPSASVLKSSPAPRDNSFDCSSRCWGWLGNCCLRPQATVLKSSPAPRDNNFDCSLNRHEITVYYYTLHIFLLYKSNKTISIFYRKFDYEGNNPVDNPNI